MTIFEIQIGDIADIKADVIVNAANERLARGTGVCGAIFAKAGNGLADEIHREFPHGCKTGDAVSTGGYGLNASYIIHAVAPIYSPFGPQNDELAAAYVAVFREADNLGVKSIAIPSLGTGIYGWDPTSTAMLAKRAIIKGLQLYPYLDKVVLACFDDLSTYLYKGLFETELKYGLDFRPRCPKCQKPALRITYGMPTREVANDPDFYTGGCSIGFGQPQLACRDCQIEFG